jgi:hypothetical protein
MVCFVTLALKSESRSILDDLISLWMIGGLQCSCKYSNPLFEMAKISV